MAKKKADKKDKGKKKADKKKADKKKAKKTPKTDVLIVPMPPVEPPKKSISQDALTMLNDLRSHSLGATLGRCGPTG